MMMKKKYLQVEKEIYYIELSETFKTLSDPTRLKIISLLSQKEFCVGELATILNTTQSNISHQLRILRSARLVKYHREGKKSFYSLDDHHIQILFKQALEHVKELYHA